MSHRNSQCGQGLAYVHVLTLLLLSEMRLVEMGGNMYRHSATPNCCILRSLGRVHAAHWYANGHVHVLICHLGGHKGLPRLLLLL